MSEETITPPDNRAYWDKRAPTFGKGCGKGAYVEAFMQRLEVQPGETVLDMGCGSGTFAVPLARAGHAALACDFSEKMIEQVRTVTEAEGLPIDAKVMAWEDDWDAFGVTEDCVDVAIASRSMGFANLRECLEKLDRVARRRVAVTVGAGVEPLSESTLMAALGRTAPSRRPFIEALNHLADMGRYGHVSYLRHRRPMVFPTFEEGRDELRRMAGREPFTPEQEEIFESFAKEHFVRAERDGEPVWELDYPLFVTWALIIWDTDGSL